MSSRDGFQIMVDFIEKLPQNRVRYQLEAALERRKPFRNFRLVLNRNDALLQQWYQFKSTYLFEWVQAHFRKH